MGRCLPVAGAAALLGLTACAALSPPPKAPPEPGAVAALDAMRPHPCNRAVAATLAGARVPVSQVRALTYDIRHMTAGGRILGYDAWIYRMNEPGSLVVTLTDTCYVQQIFARGGARPPGA